MAGTRPHVAVHVTGCHGSVAMGTLDPFRVPQEVEFSDIALFFDDVLGSVTNRRECSSFWE